MQQRKRRRLPHLFALTSAPPPSLSLCIYIYIYIWFRAPRLLIFCFFVTRTWPQVRTLSGGRAVVELDDDLLALGQRHLAANEALVAQVLRLGFKTFELRAFKSGNVSKLVL